MGEVQMDVVAEGGRARVVAIRVSESPGLGLTGVSIEQVSIRRLLDSAVEAMSLVPRPVINEAGTIRAHEPGTTQEQAMVAVRAATRRRVSDERLARVLDAAEAGGVVQVMEQEHVGERQAFRLIKRANESRRSGGPS
jgi:hypothetical protein